MNRSTWLVGMVILTSGVAARGADSTATRQDHMVALAKFDGEWRVNGQWANGENLEARTVYEWGLGKKIMKAHTFVKNGSSEYQRYESIMAWHPRKKCLYEISFTYNGEISEHVIDVVDGETLHIDFTPFEQDTASATKLSRANVRQVLKFIDADHMTWTVTMRKGEEWKQMIQATWVRQQPKTQ
jgi:hypothetical protein